MREVTASIETFQVLVKLLVSHLDDNRKRVHVPDTDYKLRTSTERDALFILSQLVLMECKEALQAGLVTDWIAKFPFGGPNSTESTKREVVQRLKNGHTDDAIFGDILRTISSYPEGKRQLRKYGLIGSASLETLDNELELMSSIIDSVLALPGRVHDESTDERARRRRRREAMVLNEGSQPVGNDNIIQPESDRMDEEW